MHHNILAENHRTITISIIIICYLDTLTIKHLFIHTVTPLPLRRRTICVSFSRCYPGLTPCSCTGAGPVNILGLKNVPFVNPQL